MGFPPLNFLTQRSDEQQPVSTGETSILDLQTHESSFVPLFRSSIQSREGCWLCLVAMLAVCPLDLKPVHSVTAFTSLTHFKSIAKVLFRVPLKLGLSETREVMCSPNAAFRSSVLSVCPLTQGSDCCEDQEGDNKRDKNRLAQLLDRTRTYCVTVCVPFAFQILQNHEERTKYK